MWSNPYLAEGAFRLFPPPEEEEEEQEPVEEEVVDPFAPSGQQTQSRKRQLEDLDDGGAKPLLLRDEGEEPPPLAGGEPSGDGETFASLGLSGWVCEACRTMGLKRPTPIQAKCVPLILQGFDVLGLAETGSGKTAAFALPLLDRLFRDPYGVFAVVLAPARELAAQIAEQFSALGARQKVRVLTLVGGEDGTRQALEFTRHRPHVVVATPGRLVEQLDRGLRELTANVEALVLDEADRLLTPTFADDLGVILKALKPKQGKKHRTTLLFSATGTPQLDEFVLRRNTGSTTGSGQPKERGTLDQRRVHKVDLSKPAAVPDGLRQHYLFMPSRIKVSYFVRLLQVLKVFGKSSRETDGRDDRRSDDANDTPSAIVFVQTCKRCHELDALLAELGVDALCLHSKLGQRRRVAALAKFRSYRGRVLVATDVASRGLDIPAVDLVVNFDVPRDPDDYVHRVGRAARAGRKGAAVTLVTQHDVDLLRDIEARVDTKLSLCPDVHEADVLDILNPVSRAINAAAVKRPYEDVLSEKDKAKLQLKLQQREASHRARDHARQRESASAARSDPPATSSKKTKSSAPTRSEMRVGPTSGAASRIPNPPPPGKAAAAKKRKMILKKKSSSRHRHE